MLRNPPKYDYKGLTIILSNPSRHDTGGELLTSGGGRLIAECLAPNFNKYQCDVRVAGDATPLLPSTKCVLLLGERATKVYLPETKDNTIGEVRGSLYIKHDIATIPTFFAQDAVDIVNWEAKHNLEYGSSDYSEEDDDNDDENAMESKRRHGKTRRKNYRFWITRDLEKVKYLLTHNGIPPKRLYEPQYVCWPKSEELIEVLKSEKNQDFYIDLETWWPSCDLKCVGFSFGVNKPIYIFPVYNYDCSWAYSNLHHIFRSLAIALTCNRVIAHNGHGFDFPLLAWKYKIPLTANLYDTMIAMHRLYSDVERSLGHCTSLGTWEPFHKDEGNTGYNNAQQVRDTLSYCGKDIYTMILFHKWIEQQESRLPGLKESIQQANSCIRPYLITSLTGLRYKEEKRLALLNENDRTMMQYLRILNILIGKDNLEHIRGKGKSSIATSNPQCVEYFHNMLHYPKVGSGKEKKDGTRGPSLAKKNMLKLRLKHENPAIDVILAYRELAKESSTIQFEPWIKQTTT